MNDKGEIIIYQTPDGATSIDVKLEKDTVWLNRQQMAELFGRDVKTIGKHIGNALKEELEGEPVVAKFATTKKYGRVEGHTQTVQTEYYSLEMVTSVGFRVKSKCGVEFRRWANKVLKEYIVRGVAVNDNRLRQLGETIKVLKRTTAQLDAKQILSVIEQYTLALDLLDDYDHQCVDKPLGNHATYVLNYDECRDIINQMRFAAESDIFGHEKDESFHSSIGAIYQTFGGEDVYPSVEEKAANLLYFITKNHSFSDGNKRIAATIFLYFLQKNGILYREDGEKRIDDSTLVAITIMIAESRTDEKEIMTRLVMNFLS